MSYIFPEIPRRACSCNHCTQDLRPGIRYESILTLHKVGYLRSDYCHTCWSSLKSQSEWENKTHWSSTVSEKFQVVTKKDPPNEMLARLREIIRNEDLASQSEAFLLSLYLSRRKILVLREELVKSEDRIFQVYEVSKTEEVFLIRKIPLSSIETGVLRENCSIYNL